MTARKAGISTGTLPERAPCNDGRPHPESYWTVVVDGSIEERPFGRPLAGRTRHPLLAAGARRRPAGRRRADGNRHGRRQLSRRLVSERPSRGCDEYLLFSVPERRPMLNSIRPSWAVGRGNAAYQRGRSNPRPGLLGRANTLFPGEVPRPTIQPYPADRPVSRAHTVPLSPARPVRLGRGPVILQFVVGAGPLTQRPAAIDSVASHAAAAAAASAFQAGPRLVPILSHRFYKTRAHPAPGS